MLKWLWKPSARRCPDGCRDMQTGSSTVTCTASQAQVLRFHRRTVRSAGHSVAAADRQMAMDTSVMMPPCWPRRDRGTDASRACWCCRRELVWRFSASGTTRVPPAGEVVTTSASPGRGAPPAHTARQRGATQLESRMAPATPPAPPPPTNTVSASSSPTPATDTGTNSKAPRAAPALEMSPWPPPPAVLRLDMCSAHMCRTAARKAGGGAATEVMKSAWGLKALVPSAGHHLPTRVRCRWCRVPWPTRGAQRPCPTPQPPRRGASPTVGRAALAESFGALGRAEASWLCCVSHVDAEVMRVSGCVIRPCTSGAASSANTAATPPLPPPPPPPCPPPLTSPTRKLPSPYPDPKPARTAVPKLYRTRGRGRKPSPPAPPTSSPCMPLSAAAALSAARRRAAAASVAATTGMSMLWPAVVAVVSRCGMTKDAV